MQCLCEILHPIYLNVCCRKSRQAFVHRRCRGFPTFCLKPYIFTLWTSVLYLSLMSKYKGVILYIPIFFAHSYVLQIFMFFLMHSYIYAFSHIFYTLLYILNISILFTQILIRFWDIFIKLMKKKSKWTTKRRT